MPMHGSGNNTPASADVRGPALKGTEPIYDPETNSVCFYVVVRGVPVKSFVTRDWLAHRYGPDVPAGAGIVDTYLEHAASIEREIARRVAAGRLEPVWLASTLPPL
jgi:hypothetical protein